jgi:hypothetical protein
MGSAYPLVNLGFTGLIIINGFSWRNLTPYELQYFQGTIIVGVKDFKCMNQSEMA